MTTKSFKERRFNGIILGNALFKLIELNSRIPQHRSRCSKDESTPVYSISLYHYIHDRNPNNPNNPNAGSTTCSCQGALVYMKAGAMREQHSPSRATCYDADIAAPSVLSHAA